MSYFKLTPLLLQAICVLGAQWGIVHQLAVTAEIKMENKKKRSISSILHWRDLSNDYFL